MNTSGETPRVDQAGKPNVLSGFTNSVEETMQTSLSDSVAPR